MASYELAALCKHQSSWGRSTAHAYGGLSRCTLDTHLMSCWLSVGKASIASASSSLHRCLLVTMSPSRGRDCSHPAYTADLVVRGMALVGHGLGVVVVSYFARRVCSLSGCERGFACQKLRTYRFVALFMPEVRPFA